MADARMAVAVAAVLALMLLEINFWKGVTTRRAQTMSVLLEVRLPSSETEFAASKQSSESRAQLYDDIEGLQ